MQRFARKGYTENDQQLLDKAHGVCTSNNQNEENGADSARGESCSVGMGNRTQACYTLKFTEVSPWLFWPNT